jgi:pyridoxal phosphate enzyme (YggS family)
MEEFGYIRRNYEELVGELSEIARRASVPNPLLVSVTKSGSDDELIALVKAGAKHLGENRPGEVLRRSQLLSSLGLVHCMHEIGTLQRNKVKLIAESAYMIHSVDSYQLAKDISRHAEKHGRKIPVLLEVNSAKEPQKSGIIPSEVEPLLNEILSLEGISVSGLMTMGPVTNSEEEIRPYFRLTKKLFDELNAKYGFGQTPTLSMGMSDSYATAIEEGATLVRIGRKLFRK